MSRAVIYVHEKTEEWKHTGNGVCERYYKNRSRRWNFLTIIRLLFFLGLFSSILLYVVKSSLSASLTLPFENWTVRVNSYLGLPHKLYRSFASLSHVYNAYLAYLREKYIETGQLLRNVNSKFKNRKQNIIYLPIIAFSASFSSSLQTNEQ